MSSSSTDADVYGSAACIKIQFDGTLEQLAARLASAPNLKSFEVAASEHPPYEAIGSAEAMGWQAWLETERNGAHGGFRLRIVTEHSFKEEFEGEMYDLSPWLARLVTALCDVKARPTSVDQPEKPG
jgi:hypothetical protein